MDATATCLNTEPTVFPTMPLLREANEIYCVVCYSVGEQRQPVMITVEKLSQVFEHREAMKNEVFQQEFASGKYIVNLTIVQYHYGKYAIHMARGEAQTMIKNVKPYCNAHGRTIRTGRAVKCVETGLIYRNATHAASANNLGQSNLSKHLRGIPGFNKVRGLTFEFCPMEEFYAQEKDTIPLNAEVVQTTPDAQPVVQYTADPNDNNPVFVPPRPGFMYDLYNREVTFTASAEPTSGQAFDWYGIPCDPVMFASGARRKHPWQPTPGSYHVRPAHQPAATAPQPPAPLTPPPPPPPPPVNYTPTAPVPPRPPNGYAPGDAPTYQVTTPDGFVLDVIRESDLDMGGRRDD